MNAATMPTTTNDSTMNGWSWNQTTTRLLGTSLGIFVCCGPDANWERCRLSRLAVSNRAVSLPPVNPLECSIT